GTSKVPAVGVPAPRTRSRGAILYRKSRFFIRGAKSGRRQIRDRFRQTGSGGYRPRHRSPVRVRAAQNSERGKDKCCCCRLFKGPRRSPSGTGGKSETKRL